MSDRGLERLPRLSVTLGDMAGIGPELVLRALREPAIAQKCRLVVYGNHRLLARVAASAGLPFETQEACATDRLTFAHHRGQLQRCGEHLLIDFDIDGVATIAPGRVQALCGQKAYDWVKLAAADTLNALTDGLVTAPLSKAALHAAGCHFPGHTEILASLTDVSDPCMAFYAERLLVALVTIHEPLALVPQLLKTEKLLRTIEHCACACRRLNRNGAIAVLALNPHAGEDGLFGDQEKKIIQPAIAAARAQGIDTTGPLVPDTAFTWLGTAAPSPYAAYVAMYHDQGLIPFKMAAFDSGVNFTLGLPLIRTSPDHGTAFDLAWQGRASPHSFYQAIHLACRLASAPSPRPSTAER